MLSKMRSISHYRTVQLPDCDIFTNMAKSEFRQFRALCIEMVLHTDMSQHFSQLKAMKTMLQQNSSEPRYVRSSSVNLL